MLQEKNRISETTHVSDIGINSVEFDEVNIYGGEEELVLRIEAEYNVWVTRNGSLF